MKSFSKKSVSLVLIFTILMAIFMPTIVSAVTTQQQGNKIVNTTTSETVTFDGKAHNSMIYAGEIKKDGVTVLNYLYSSDVTRSSVLFDNVRKALPNPYSDLVPTLSGEQTTSGLHEMSTQTLNGKDLTTITTGWTNAVLLAPQIFDGTLSDMVNENMYDVDNSFKSEIDTNDTERKALLDQPLETHKRVISHLGTKTTDDVSFNVVEGNTMEVHNVDLIYLSEATTVVYTSVNVLSEIPQTTEQKNITVNPEMVTLYVGNISENGTSKLKYLYSDGAVDTATLTEIKKILPSDYQAILPTTEGQVKASNDNSVVVQDFYTDAGMVAVNRYPDKTITNTSSTKLYNESAVAASKNIVTSENNAVKSYSTTYDAQKDIWKAANPGLDFSDVYEYEPPYLTNNDLSTVAGDFIIVDENYIPSGSSGTKFGMYKGQLKPITITYVNRKVVKIVNTSANATIEETQANQETPNTPTYNYIYGQNQTYTINEDDTLKFRINADFSLFENGGKVYVDGTETKEFTASSGSTIITFAKDYVSSLSEGEHTLKVAFNNGGEATTKFTVSKANTTTEETTPTTTTETETTSNNPKTGDNIAIWISLMVVSMLGIAGTVKFVKKNK